MRILLTGVSSFTGAWFAHTLAQAGHEVVAPLRGSSSNYTGNRLNRVKWIAGRVRFVEETPFGSEGFLRLLDGQEPFDACCHHGAEVANYRSPDFDAVAALASNTAGLRPVLEKLKGRNPGAALILTGSVFENDEGIGDAPLRAFSPYGLSKGLTAQYVRHYCAAAGVKFGKFVIPNPFGPHEEPRFTAYLIRTWKSGAAASVQTPSYVRDNIHVDLLSLAYLEFVENLVGGSGRTLCHPSGYVESQGAFAMRFAEAMRARLRLECKLELKAQKEFSEPVCRINHEPSTLAFPHWSEPTAWDAIADFYR